MLGCHDAERALELAGSSTFWVCMYSRALTSCHVTCLVSRVPSPCGWTLRHSSTVCWTYSMTMHVRPLYLKGVQE